jgi:hypothetical protein
MLGADDPPAAHEEPAMQYAVLIYDEGTADPSTIPAHPAIRQQMHLAYDAYTQMLQDSGVMKGGEALQPVTTATTIRVRDDETLLTDGPFAETKEALAGFYLIEASDLDAAIKLAAACPGAKVGSIEVRPVADYSSTGAG